MTSPHPQPPSASRRLFIKQSSAAVIGSGLLAKTAIASAGRRAEGLGDRRIRVALVGCGGRGTGAAVQALRTEGDVQLVAMADAFSDRLEGSLEQINRQVGERVNVPPARRFVGFDAYKQAIECETEEGPVDLVILATPPGFRPMHFEHAIAQDKHVFMEKPVAVDGPGVRKVLASGELATAKNLKVGVGLQRHHQASYLETVQRIQEGAIGEIAFYRCYWNSAGVWVRPRQEGMTEMEYQMRNWYYFNWLCGDHIVEQHIHNLDVCNWIQGDFPVKAEGMGGRQVRTGIDNGEIFDHFFVEYTYADGKKMYSQCRHQPGTKSSVSEHVHGTAGYANVSGHRIEEVRGGKWRYQADESSTITDAAGRTYAFTQDPYQQEHHDLFHAVRNDIAHNEAEYGAKSTLTAILGRMAAYSGKQITFEQALNSELALVPDAYTWTGTPPTVPDENGRYPIPTPGQTTAV